MDVDVGIALEDKDAGACGCTVLGTAATANDDGGGARASCFSCAGSWSFLCQMPYFSLYTYGVSAVRFIAFLRRPPSNDLDSHPNTPPPLAADPAKDASSSAASVFEVASAGLFAERESLDPAFVSEPAVVFEPSTFSSTEENGCTGGTGDARPTE